MPTLDEPGERKIAFGLPTLTDIALIQHFLHALPQLARHQRLMDAAVGLALPDEIARVDAVAQDALNGGLGHCSFAAWQSQPRGSAHGYEVPKGVLPRGIPFE